MRARVRSFIMLFTGKKNLINILYFFFWCYNSVQFMHGIKLRIITYLLYYFNIVASNQTLDIFFFIIKHKTNTNRGKERKREVSLCIIHRNRQTVARNFPTRNRHYDRATIPIYSELVEKRIELKVTKENHICSWTRPVWNARLMFDAVYTVWGRQRMQWWGLARNRVRALIHVWRWIGLKTDYGSSPFDDLFALCCSPVSHRAF